MICIRNSTVTFTFCQNNRPTAFSHTEFRAMATHGICTEYAPRRFPAIVLRIRGYNSGDPDGVATALLFRSGRVVMTGVRAPTCGLCSDSQRDGASGAPPGSGGAPWGWTLSRCTSLTHRGSESAEPGEQRTLALPSAH
ncbi:hypothetical protein niasHS_016552 [Heterodera schachtii]|uniref:Uncharacterized protein n=1 Tax=Heterodera schachtii TaxID=97005 RepID=A0ABD2HS01_HETSC